MHNQLHDELDAAEDMRERVQEIVEKVRPKLIELVRETGDTEKALEVIAALVAAELAGLTTEAVAMGAKHARQRTETTGLGLGV